jgi:hypothetical protein
MAENRYIEGKVVEPQPEASINEIEETEASEPKAEEPKEKEKPKKKSKRGNIFMQVLGGGFLAKKKVSRQFPFWFISFSCSCCSSPTLTWPKT